MLLFSFRSVKKSTFENFFIVRLVSLELTVQNVTLHSKYWLHCGYKCHCYLYVGLQFGDTNSTRQVLVSTRFHQDVAGWRWCLFSERTEQVSLSVNLTSTCPISDHIAWFYSVSYFFSPSPTLPGEPGPPHCRAFPITFDRIPLEEWSENIIWKQQNFQDA
jgi:hypothetical protein